MNPLKSLFVLGMALVLQLWEPGHSLASVSEEGTEANFSKEAAAVTISPTVAEQGTWNTQAGSFRGKNGQRYTFTFPAGTPTSKLWGTDLYTDDSSIATAAVHAGLITPQSGGTVTIEIRPAAPSYKGSTRNGVTSKSYGSFGGSFVFVGQGVGETSAAPPTPPAAVIPSATTRGDWNTQASQFRGKNGQRFSLTFPAGTPTTRLWGTDLYTDDSSIATAALHAGLITPQSGGTVTIEIRPAAPSYKGSTRNGVTSKSYGSFGGSFVFVGNGEKISTVSPGSSTSGAIPIDIAGSWYGSTDKRGRLNFWQNGDEFMVIMSWPDDAAGVWESYRGEGKLKGRLMEFKVFPSSKEGRSIDQGYVYYLTVSDDNKSITGYYTVNGVKADRGTMHYYRVQ